MPILKKHLELSLRRTGRDYKEVHEWLDGKNLSSEERTARHDIINIPRFLPVVEKRFGRDGVEEYLQHIKDDYYNSVPQKIFDKMRRSKFW